MEFDESNRGKKKKGEREKEISASTDGGPRSRVCARETLRSAPINTSGNFPAPMSAESPSNISYNPTEVISEVSEP